MAKSWLTLWPHELQPTRLFCPCKNTPCKYSPGKNTQWLTTEPPGKPLTKNNFGFILFIFFVPVLPTISNQGLGFVLCLLWDFATEQNTQAVEEKLLSLFWREKRERGVILRWRARGRQPTSGRRWSAGLLGGVEPWHVPCSMAVWAEAVRPRLIREGGLCVAGRTGLQTQGLRVWQRFLAQKKSNKTSWAEMTIQTKRMGGLEVNILWPDMCRVCSTSV